MSGFFSDIADGIGSFFNSGAGKAATSLAGTALSTIGNENAADTIAQGNEDALNFYKQQAAQARQDLLDSKAQATGTLTDANAKATGALQPAIAAGLPARQMLQGAMTADPSKLTPLQKIGLDDMTRQTMNNLSVSGMRGAGYGGQAVLGDATQRYLAGAYNTNQARSDAAANTLNNQGYGASQGKANADLGTGTSIANADLGVGSSTANVGLGTGQVGSNLTQSTAGTNAAADIANARSIAGELGSLSGTANYSDQQKAADPYANFNATNQARSDVTSGNPIFAKGGVVPGPLHMIGA